MITPQFLFDCNLLAQLAPTDSPLQGSAGTLVIALVCCAAGYVTGLCIWREDRRRYAEAEKVNIGLQAQIIEATQ
ncbi:MAG: hypothetical protein ACI9R3_005799 [Verrucomicrobiales bacterium]|jgi:hypothetical protein